VIIAAVPLGTIGGLLGLAALNAVGGPFGIFQPLDVLTMLGFVILIGTVVNNPILIVDRALQLVRFEGAEPTDAILEAVQSRIRPIFMTTFTTVLGLLPLVIFPGAGSELYRGLGSVLLGGLLVTETLFNYRGLGLLVFDAAGGVLVPDLPIQMWQERQWSLEPSAELTFRERKADGSYDRLDGSGLKRSGIEGGWVAATHHGQGAVLRAGLTARNGGVDEGHTLCFRRGVQFPRHVGRGGGVVDHGGAGAHARQHAIGAQHDRTQIVVVADAHEHDLGTL
jgi:hypothetical protein